MSRVFLLGDPVAHSMSPAMQNAAFAALGLRHRYALFAVPAKDLPGVVRTVLRKDDVLGANVTIPHKERMAPLLDQVEDTARRIGAVNTVFKRAGALVGENTDAGGFADALAERGVELDGRRVLVLGAGGAARACVDHLIRSRAHVIVTNRTAERAERFRAAIEASLPASIGVGHSVGALSWPVRAIGDYEVVVNATALGLHGEDPLEGADLPSSTIVVDIVATAGETPLVRRARAAGCVAVDGLLMLLHQGARAFKLWTGLDAPVAAMRAALPREV